MMEGIARVKVARIVVWRKAVVRTKAAKRDEPI